MVNSGGRQHQCLHLEKLDIIIENIINKEKIAMIDDIFNKKKADDYIKQIEFNK